MSTPYPPAGGGQQQPGPYGAPGPSSWGPVPGGQPYGAPGPGAPGPGYGGFGGPGGPGGAQQGYGPGSGQQAPGQYGPPGAQAPGQYGPGPQGPGGVQYGSPAPKASKPPRAPKAAGKPVDLGRILPLALGVLGVLGFLFGFLHALTVGDDSVTTAKYSVYQLQGHLPILVLIVGLFGVAPLLPGGKKFTLPTALLSIATLLAAITALTAGSAGYGSTGNRGAGLILLLVVALLQAAIAVYAWLSDAGVVKAAPAKNGSTSGSGSTAGPSTSTFGPSPSGQSGQRPPAGERGGSAGFAPGGFGAPQGGPEAGTYGGYQPSGYRPESYGAQPSTGPGEAVGRQEPGDQPRRGEEPPPDVTQQVRF